MKNNTAKWQSIVGFLGLAAFLLALGLMIRATSAHAGSQNPTTTNAPNWTHLSTADGELPVPSSSTQQVLTLIADIDNDGLNDFVIGSRRGNGPSLVWLHREAAGWTRYVIESDVLQMEAGGAYHDIDGDGDLDIVAGSNAQTNAIWWWENPYPNHSAGTDWTRRFIKNSGGNKHHDMMFGNFDDDPATEFVFWNQNEKKLFSVDIPAAPLTTEPWPDVITVFDAPDNKREGLAQADIDGDGKSDIIGGGYWFKHTDGPNYQANLIEDGVYMRVAAGQLIPGGRPEIVQVPGDADGAGRWFQWDGAAWIGRDLPAGTIRQGHSLELGDANADGNLDIFVGEMRFASGHNNSNPNARTLLLLGDGLGNFAVETIATGFGHHESRLADLDGDGDLDILGKPFTWDTPRLDVWLNNSQQPVCGPSMAYWDTHVIDGERPYRAVFVDAADVDGDGLQDIITGAWWYRNPGQPGGSWPRHEIGAPLNQMAVVADFDGDGDADILGTVLAAGASSNKLHEGSDFVWARNDGAGNFQILDNIDAGTGDFLQGAVVGRFNGNSQEVMLSWHNRADTVQSLIIPSDPAAEQWTIRSATPLSQSEDLSAGDIDGDNDLDLLLGSMWLENDGNNWNTHTLFTTTDKPDRNRLADLNGDSRLDAVIGYEKSNSTAIRLAWYEAPADPTQPWTEHVIDDIVAPMSLDVGDMDGDGDVDIVAGEHNKSHPLQGRVFAYENQGASFQTHLIATGDEHHDGTQLVDIDNDGDLDVMSIGWNHGRVLLYEHLGCDLETMPTHTPPPGDTPSPTPVSSTATPDVTETLTVVPTTTGEPTGTPIPGSTPTATATTSAPGIAYYFSFNSDGEVGGVSFADEDIMRFDPATGAWSLYIDGSDIGLAKNNIDAFHIRPDGSLLFSTAKPFKPAGLPKFDDSDILYFDPHSLGEVTGGTFALHFDGSDVGLTTSGENIGGLMELPDGRLLISTYGSAAFPDLKAKDEDILLFTPAGLGAETSGTWTLYFKGSAIGLSTKHEDIRGIAMTGDSQLHLTTLGDFQVGEAAGSASDVFLCSLATTGEQTVCAPPPSIIWHGSPHGLDDHTIDGLSMD